MKISAFRLGLGILALVSFSPCASARILRPVPPGYIGGTKLDAATWKAVVPIKSTGSGGCLATIVGPRAILTGALCGATSSKVTFVINGKTYTAVITRSTLMLKGHALSVGVVNEDLPVTPLSVSATTPSTGTEVMLVGTNCQGASAATSPDIYGAKTLISAVDTNYFKTSVSGGPLICQEDLGGPAMHEGPGGWKVIGVNSGVEVDNDDKIVGPNHSSRLDAAAHREVLTKIATANGVDICGVTKECGSIPDPAGPTCELKPSAQTVRVGDPVVLTLTSQNATSAKINGQTVNLGVGTITVFPQSAGSKTAFGEVANASKTGSCSTSYTVVPKTDPSPLSCTLTALPSKVGVGEFITLELTATGPATAASIDGNPVGVPSGKRTVQATKKGDFSVVGFVSGGGASANCHTDYSVTDGGPAPSLPNYGVGMAYCGPDSNAALTGISRVCLGVVKKDPGAQHTGFGEVVHVRFSSGKEELLPIVARRPVAGSSQREELGLFANNVTSGSNGASMDVRLATLTKVGGSPTQIEGATLDKKNFRVNLTAQ